MKHLITLGSLWVMLHKPDCYVLLRRHLGNINQDFSKACTVTAGSASNITLGPVNTTATNTSASNTISINCSKTTPYFIGLAPSAANGGTTTGSGAMSSVANAATNTDKVPYQLNRTSATGPVWGNTATDTAPGNGVAATGTGLVQTFTVYATAPSANFTPDDYADTVTVNVNY
ncbi:spore coat U domain-containing protein [Citrobacter freundii]|uniref:Csu type fimbrial protein n=1 Tax=Citrobacter freundii TaxID=546 RepID=UPI0039C9E8A6